MTFEQWWDKATEYIHFLDCRAGTRKLCHDAWYMGRASAFEEMLKEQQHEAQVQTEQGEGGHEE